MRPDCGIRHAHGSAGTGEVRYERGNETAEVLDEFQRLPSSELTRVHEEDLRRDASGKPEGDFDHVHIDIPGLREAGGGRPRTHLAGAPTMITNSTALPVGPTPVTSVFWSA